ncbi:MAG: cysteine desulfurase [Candidatus Brocadiia bacterium]
MFDVESIRRQFPALERTFNGRPVIFADNAATSLKPQSVIAAVNYYYTEVCANVHRGINAIAQEADALYEEARESCAELLNADGEEIIFVRNATEGLNLAAHMMDLGPGDEIVCSLADHHSNFLPWHTKARTRLVVPDADGRVSAADFMAQVSEKTKLIALGHVSNVTGVICPVEEVIREARRRGILTIVDGAQSVPHMPIDVRALGCDMLAFSGHKMLGPSGIGGLYVRGELLESALPMLHGGGMVSSVTTDDFRLEHGPHRFEAGTPNIEGALGMGAAARFLMKLGMENVFAHERQLARRLIGRLAEIDGLRLYPSKATENRLAVAAFGVPGMSENDAAAVLCNRHNVMARSGVHCAEPLVRQYGETGLVRVSLHLYNTLEEVDHIADAVGSLCRVFA